jgi:hypothetical protein
VASIFIWLVAIVLEGAPVVRSVRGHFIKHYKFFYCYLCFILFRDLYLFGVYYLVPKMYAWSYWSTELVTVLLGCGLVWEAYKLAFAAYKGAARIAANVLPVIFIFVITRVLIKAWDSPNWIPGRTPLETELDLRIVQAALLLGLLALFAWYAIPLGRNLRGIIYGYALFLATSVAGLMLRRSLGEPFQRLWQYLDPASYTVVLFVWCWCLWSYAPVPRPKPGPNLESDYEALVARTRNKLHWARVRLLRGVRP